MKARSLLMLVGLCAGLLACGKEPTVTHNTQPESQAASTGSLPVAQGKAQTGGFFVDVTKSAGIDFVHRHGGTGKKYLPETMGAGGVAFDYDQDGLLDIYLVQSGSLTGDESYDAANRLYRNQGDGRFEDFTVPAGVGQTGYGMGAVSADYDNDGDPDLYVVNFGPDVLYRNNGDGTFSDVSKAAGIANDRWGSSAAFFDANRDGHLDLYVVNYLDFAVETHIDCGTPSRGFYSYCTPDVYEMAADVFFLSNGDGTFTDATEATGLLDASGSGKGLGLVAGDFSGDGWPDVYVANDSTPNYLLLNMGDGTFEESAVWMGASHNEDGMTEAGMGVDAGDINGDGHLDVFVSNLSNESNALYRGGEQGFSHESRSAGIFAGSLLPLGFGVDFMDVDNDADLDIVVANGHVIDNIALLDDAQSAKQAAQVFLNDGGGNFKEMPAADVGDIAVPGTGRGIISLDYDNDGRRDLLITYNNEPARLFRNTGQSANAWIGFDLQGRAGNRDAVGARISVEAGGKTVTDEKKAGSGYQTSGDPRMHFGLGEAQVAEKVTVAWPSGRRQVFENLPGGRYHRLTEPD